MLDALFPPTLDDVFRGHRAALWILGLLALMKVAMGVGSVVNGRAVAAEADGIPLATFSPDAQRTVLALFAVWGFCQILLGLVGVVALARYQGMVPFAFLLLLIENAGRKVILHFIPYTSASTTSNLVVNGLFIVLMLAGLVLSTLTPAARATG